MNDLMLINNVLYALKECTEPIFILKSDIEKALGEDPVSCTTIRECIYINGKFYAYYIVEQKKKDDERVCKTNNGNS